MIRNSFTIVLTIVMLVVVGCGKSTDVADSGDPAQTPESSGPKPEQVLEGYTFNGFSQGTDRSWEVKGRSAEIFTEFIKMFNVKAQAFAEDGPVSVTEAVKIGDENTREKEDQLQDEAQQQNSELEQEPIADKKEEAQRPTIITCDGRLDIYHEKKIAKFYDNVFLDAVGGKVYCDQMDIFIDPETKSVTKAIAIGNVKIVKGSNISYSQRAIYDLKTKVISLLPAAESETGSASESGSQVKLIIYPDEGGKIAPFGD